MKKALIIAIGLYCGFAQAQTLEDALRFSQTSIEGSARYAAMGGAFGALGGDFSAFTINPAGSSVFSFSEMALSLGYTQDNIQTSYNGQKADLEGNQIRIPQIGAVFVLDNTSNSQWSKITLGLHFQKTHDFDQSSLINGYSSQGLDQYFLSYSQGRYLGDISLLENETFREAYVDIGERQGLGYPGQQALFGYEGYLINGIPLDGSTDTTHPDIRSYESNTSPGSGGYRHTLYNNTNGGIKKYTLNLSSVYQKKLYLGLNINTYRLEFSQNRDFYESNYGSTSGIQAANFVNTLQTSGSGSSLQIGALYRLNNAWRFGLSLESPTYYRLNDRIRQSLTVEVNNANVSLLELNPEIETIFPDYEFQTPGQFRASLAYIIGDKGLISFDYSTRNFGQMKYSPDNEPFFQSLNQTIDHNYQANQRIQFGGEFRVSPQLSLRGGYQHETSPSRITDQTLTVYSTGVGLNFGASNLDIALVQSNRTNSNMLFARGLDQNYDVENEQFSFQITYRLKL